MMDIQKFGENHVVIKNEDFIELVETVDELQERVLALQEIIDKLSRER